MPRLDGIDIAHFQYDQGPVDLGAVAAIPTFWFASKATQSTSYVDPTFATSRAAAAPAGFTHVGAYHWLSSITDPVLQADHFLATIGTLHPGEFCMLDAEEGGITVAGCLAWCEHVEATTRRPCVIYSGLYVSGGTIWKSTALRTSRFGPRPFIVAAYVTEANLAARMVQTGSTPNFPHDGWQFASGGVMPNGAHLPGIVGRCDEDQIDNRPAFDLAAGLTAAPQPAPTEDSDMLRLLAPTDSPARFYAVCDPAGRALRCEWTGDGNDPAVVARLKFYADATPVGTPFEMVLDTGAFINISLDGPLPAGFRAEQFGNPAEITARMTAGTVDSVARKGVSDLNASVATLGQELGDTKMNLAKAGA